MCDGRLALWLLVWLGLGGVSDARVLLGAVGSHIGYTGKNAAPSTFGKSVSTAPSKLSVKQQRHGQGGITHMAAREIVGADTFDGTVNFNMRAFKVKRTKKSDGTTRLSLTKGVRPRSVRPVHWPCCALDCKEEFQGLTCRRGASPGAWAEGGVASIPASRRALSLVDADSCRTPLTLRVDCGWTRQPASSPYPNTTTPRVWGPMQRGF